MKNSLTVDQVAAALQVDPYTVRRWLRGGTLIGERQGRHWRILESDLDRFMAERRTGKD